LFKRNWQYLVQNNVFRPDNTQPLFYLKNDGFWQLKDANFMKITSKPSSENTVVRNRLKGALTPEAAEHFSNPVSRELIRMTLLDTYFPDIKHRYIAEQGLDETIRVSRIRWIMGWLYAPTYIGPSITA
jgi:hypothetical protein